MVSPNGNEIQLVDIKSSVRQQTQQYKLLHFINSTEKIDLIKMFRHIYQNILEKLQFTDTL